MKQDDKERCTIGGRNKDRGSEEGEPSPQRSAREFDQFCALTLEEKKKQQREDD